MAAPRKKSPKKQAEEQVAELFGDPSPTEKARAKRTRRKASDAVHREKHEAIAAGLGLSPAAEAAAAAINAGRGEELGVHGNASAQVIDDHTISVGRRVTGVEPAILRPRVVFHEVRTTRLEQIDYDDFENVTDEGVSRARVDGAFVKVSAALRPSEREAFDGAALKEQLRAAGARAVLLAVHPVAELPDQEAREEVSVAARPEDAIEAWFAGLPVPEEDRAAAQELALEILGAEGG